MKFGIKLGNVEYKEIKLENIEVNVQYTAEELVTEFDLVKRIVKELPEMIADLGTGAMAFKELYEAFDGMSREMHKEDATVDSKATASNFVLTAINKIKSTYISKEEVLKDKAV